MQEALHDTTDLAFNNSRYHGDEFLLVKFFVHPRENGPKSVAAERPIFEDTTYIQIMQPGNKDSIVIRPATARDKDRFAEHYRKWEARRGDEEAIEGTLLEEWAGVTRSQVEELRFMNVRTVEQLANMSDTNAQNMMGLNMLRQKALDWLDSVKDNATQEALAAANARIDELMDRLNAGDGMVKRKRRTKAEIEADKASQEEAQE